MRAVYAILGRVAIVNGRIWNALFWSRLIQQDFVPTIDAYGKCLTTRLLPAFSTVDAEAERLEQDVCERLEAFATQNTDPASDAEQAVNEAVSFLQLMHSIQQGLVNLFTAGLYHLFEQQLLHFHNRELLSFEEQQDLADAVRKLDARWIRNLSNPNLAQERLLMAGIDIKNFSTWPRMCELRHVANVIKHGDGSASAALRRIRPDLFVSPIAQEMDLPVAHVLVDAPLMGEGIYVSEDEHRKFVDVVKNFWAEVAAALKVHHQAHHRERA